MMACPARHQAGEGARGGGDSLMVDVSSSDDDRGTVKRLISVAKVASYFMLDDLLDWCAQQAALVLDVEIEAGVRIRPFDLCPTDDRKH